MKKPLNQERLKLIASVAMLLDHIGATMLPWEWLRVVGRLAFPIYCFLLSEGVAHTRSARRYVLRLAAIALLAEVPFDLLLYGKLTFTRQNVMFTLILGVLAVKSMEKTDRIWIKILVCTLAILLAEWLQVDYGGAGVLLILSMVLVRSMTERVLAMASIFLVMGGIQIFGLLALIPIGLYSGERKGTGRWLFYFFYPAHLTVLLLLDKF